MQDRPRRRVGCREAEEARILPAPRHVNSSLSLSLCLSVCLSVSQTCAHKNTQTNTTSEEARILLVPCNVLQRQGILYRTSWVRGHISGHHLIRPTSNKTTWPCDITRGACLAASPHTTSSKGHVPTYKHTDRGRESTESRRGGASRKEAHRVAHVSGDAQLAVRLGSIRGIQHCQEVSTVKKIGLSSVAACAETIA